MPERPPGRRRTSPGTPANPEQRVNRAVVAAVVVLSAAMLALVGRVAALQLKPGDALRGHMSDRMAEASVPALRGELLDRRGRLLSTTRFGYRAFIDPVEFAALPPDASDEAILRVSEATGTEADALAERLFERLAENERRARMHEQGEDAPGLVRYLAVGSVLSDESASKIRSIDIPGVHLEQRPVREYVAGPHASAIVGKVGFENTGLLGAELSLDLRLRETSGTIRYVRDARGRPLWVSPEDWHPGSPGDSTRLAIDLEIQRIAAEELEHAMEECDAAGGRIIVLDPHTGEVLAMADLTRPVTGAAPFPWEDASGPRGSSREPDPRSMPRYDVVPHPAPGALPRNRCVEDVYEPGSTFKSFVWGVITSLGRARVDEVFDTEGGRWRTGYGRPVADVVKRGSSTWAEVLIYSSNIGMVKAGERLSFEELREAVTRFGFGRPTGIGLPGEASGIVTSAKGWSKYTQTSVCFGYEVAVTPVQMVRAFSAFARTGELAGTLPELRLTALDPDAPESRVTRRVLPASVATEARRIMGSVAENMERRMDHRGEPKHEWKYTMFGKSGTANIALGAPPAGFRRPTWSNGYAPDQYNSSFIAAGPTEAPRIVVLAIIDDPGPERIRARTHYGSYTAGPVVRRVMERSLAYLGAPTSPHAGSSGE